MFGNNVPRSFRWICYGFRQVTTWLVLYFQNEPCDLICSGVRLVNKKRASRSIKPMTMLPCAPKSFQLWRAQPALTASRRNFAQRSWPGMVILNRLRSVLPSIENWIVENVMATLCPWVRKMWPRISSGWFSFGPSNTNHHNLLRRVVIFEEPT